MNPISQRNDRRIIAWRCRSADQRVASTRIRCLMPMQYLAGKGKEVEPFKIHRLSHYSAVIFIKAYDDDAIAEAQRAKQAGCKIIFDLCDNHFYNPNNLPPLTRAQTQLRQMISIADCVVASTEPLADVIKTETNNKTPVNVIGDAIDDGALQTKMSPVGRILSYLQTRRISKILAAERQRGITSLVWFGIHGGPNAHYGMNDLETILPLLKEVHQSHPLSLTVISNSQSKFERIFQNCQFPAHYVSWHYRTFFSLLRAFTIAVIPISKNPFTICKSNNRIALALHCGLGVVADAIPSYEVFRGVCHLDNWSVGLRDYLTNPQHLQQHVKAGQKLVLSECGIEAIGTAWLQLFDSLGV